MDPMSYPRSFMNARVIKIILMTLAAVSILGALAYVFWEHPLGFSSNKPLQAVTYGAESDFERGTMSPIADAAPAVRHAVEIRVPTAMQVEKHGDSLLVRFPTLVRTNVTIGYKMEYGIEWGWTILHDGMAHPLHREVRSVLDFPPGTRTLTLDRGAIAGPAKEFTLEHQITIFETDMPVQHMWSPQSGAHYQVLWTRTFRATVR